MTKPALRIAQPDSPQSLEMGEVILALARLIVAQAPTAVMMIWEVPGQQEYVQLEARSIPDSIALRKGLISILYDKYFPPQGPME